MNIEWSKIGVWLKQAAKNVGNSLLYWTWTKKLVYWIIISAGTMSELAFLAASLWMSLNASIHSFIVKWLTEQQTINISSIATAAYVALPECIVVLALVTTINRAKMWRYTGRWLSISGVWCILYALPTLVFLWLSVFTLGNSVASTSFTLPEWMVVTRAIAGYGFALVSILYIKLGDPSERERLTQKDEKIESLNAEIEQQRQSFTQQLQDQTQKSLSLLEDQKNSFLSQIDILKQELEVSKELLSESKTYQTQLIKAVNQSSEMALQAYSEECQNWLNSGVKTATIEEITRYTSHSKQKIRAAIDKGLLQKAPRGKSELILISSLIPWLKNNQPARMEQETPPQLHIVNA